MFEGGEELLKTHLSKNITSHLAIFNLIFTIPFFILNFRIFRKILRGHGNISIYRAERFLSLGRMSNPILMLLFTMGSGGAPAFWIVCSPILNSFWMVVDPGTGSLKVLFLCALISLELIYFILLKRNPKTFKSNINTEEKESFSQNEFDQNKTSDSNNDEFNKTPKLILAFKNFCKDIPPVIIALGSMMLLAVLGLTIFFIYGITKEKEDPNAINFIELQGSKARAYHLEIPNGYIRKRNKITSDISIETVYPGMEGKNPENRHRFKRGRSNRKGKDVVSISMWPKLEKTEGTYTKKNEREERKEFLLNKSTIKYKLVPTPNHIKESEKIDKFVQNHDEEDQGLYIIYHDDLHTSKIKCTLKTICTGRTSWEDHISIRYDFRTKYFNEMVDLDRSIIVLINQFNPKIIH